MKILLIDGNSIGHAAHRSTKLHSGGMETQAVFGFLRTMQKLRLEYRDYVPMVLWDGKAQWRFDLHPPYKSNRDNDAKKKEERESYKKQRPYISKALSALGVRQLTCMSMEADDLAGHFVEKLSAKPDNKIVLISGDQDWLQLVRKNVSWRDMRDDAKVIDAKNFYEKTGCKTPFAFLETKILTGDTSDVISGVGGIGEKGAPEFIAEFGSVREFWRRCDSGEFTPTVAAHKRLLGTSPFTKEEWIAQQVSPAKTLSEKERQKLDKAWADAWPGQGRSIYKRNFQLMQLLKVNQPKPEDIVLDKGKFDSDLFAEICGELAFVSLLRKLDEFTQFFK